MMRNGAEMRTLVVPREKIDFLAAESERLTALAVEMEKVIDFYRDHPHFPLDYEKVRGKITEAHERLQTVMTTLAALREG